MFSNAVAYEQDILLKYLVISDNFYNDYLIENNFLNCHNSKVRHFILLTNLWDQIFLTDDQSHILAIN